jgi:WD40 repeat protein
MNCTDHRSKKTQGQKILAFQMFALCLCVSVVNCFAEDKINYQDHVLPLIEANCSKCHNADKKKADLDLTSYQGALQGSGSGAVLVSGNPDSSKLWKAITHAEEPNMPPNRPRLAEKDLAIFKQWIAGGLLETANGKAVAAAKPAVDLTLKPGTSVRPEGPPPMPGELPFQQVQRGIRGNAILGLTASPWAPLLAVSGHEQVLLFHSETLALIGALPFTEGQPLDLKFSRNGKLLLAAGGHGAQSGHVALWDVASGKRLATLGQEYDSVLAADIRADQSQVALGGPSRLVKVLTVSNGELLHKLKKHTDWVTAVSFSPNSQMLASADRNGAVIIWDPESGQDLFSLSGHKSAVTALSWRDDSKLLASASEDGSIKLWEMQEGKQVKNWNAHNSGALSVSYSHTGQLVSCGRDGQVLVWDGNGNKIRKLESASELPLRAVFTEDGKRIFTTDFEGTTVAWNAADGKRIGELKGGIEKDQRTLAGK